jgi:ribosomal protein S18 acetylase RimI-like enzyme
MENLVLSDITETYRILPAGYQARPAQMDDVEAAVELWNAWSRQVLGVDKFDPAETAGEWETPGFNLATDTCVVIAPEGRLVGYGEIWDAVPHVTINYWGHAHPDYDAPSIEAYLLKWAERRARQSIPKAPPEARVALTYFQLSIDEATARPVKEAGFELIRHSLRMVIELNGKPPEPEWPAGITVRATRPGQDERAIFQAIREAFKDHWGYVDRPFDDEFQRFLHRQNTREGFDPTLWFLAMDGDEIAGVSLCWNKVHDDPDMGWVGTLGVRRNWRRRGLGLALLQHSINQFYQRGWRKVGLGVDAQNLTGATRLYLRAGMRSDPEKQHDLYEKELRPGYVMGTQKVED